MMVHPLHEVEELRDEAERLENQFLRKRGWEYVCDTPGSFWLWQKKLPDGRVMLVNKATALQAEQDSDDIEDVGIEGSSDEG